MVITEKNKKKKEDVIKTLTATLKRQMEEVKKEKNVKNSDEGWAMLLVTPQGSVFETVNTKSEHISVIVGAIEQHKYSIIENFNKQHGSENLLKEALGKMLK